MNERYMEALLEEVRGKFDLVMEGYEALRAEIRESRRESNEKHAFTALQIRILNDKIDNVATELRGEIHELRGEFNGLRNEFNEFRQESTVRHDHTDYQFKVINHKIDAVAADLAAHRADTEAHPRYLVRE